MPTLWANEACADLQTHTPVQDQDIPSIVEEFVRCIYADPFAMEEVRRMIGESSISHDLSRISRDQVLRQVERRLFDRSLRAVACGFESTTSGVTLVAYDDSRYHIGLNLGQMVTCLAYPSHKVLHVENVTEAGEMLVKVANLCGGMSELRKAASLQTGLRDLPRSDEALLESLAKLLMEGRLILVGCGSAGGSVFATGLYAEEEPAPTRSRSGSSAGTSQREPQAPAEEKVKTWIEIRLVDEEGKPVANERYRLELPDGTVKEGSLDQNGRARVEEIDPGNCKVSFLDIHGQEWKPA